MENIYMWVFNEKPENALGKMQLWSYMNGHSREGDQPFPFSGLSNPQCIHGIEVVPLPNLTGLDDSDCRRWAKLTGRDPKFTIIPEASDYSLWRNQPTTEFEL
ncbi:HSP20-like chaperones superfamily [Olea europaea subsp. europaea]|uniref:HSP20-like chaperones superfamily n=1 Tax=Olea europaea subsp. europaea TaxID=158383 RepID=A0A8S0VI14_OLEEU|nr:HSP20-like chaperones superfamily [Olea europaea subsp. europaea]